MPILFALASAAVYGVADYLGGRASRLHPSAVVTLVGQMVSFAMVLVAVASMGTPVPSSGTLAWGAVAGVAGAVGLTSLYHAFAHGAVTVVAPLSAVVGAVLPVGAGLAHGERPAGIAYVGIVLAVVAVALVSGAVGERRRPTPPAIVGFAVLAGTGFGVLFVALDRSDGGSGFWPLVAARAASVPLLLVLCLVTGARPTRRRGGVGGLAIAMVAGSLDMLANLLYLAASREGLLSIVAVVASLYPASTVALAFVIDRERVDRWQSVGMAVAVGALVLVTLGR